MKSFFYIGIMEHPLSNYSKFLNRLKEYEKKFPAIRCTLSCNPELTAEVVRKDLRDNPTLSNLSNWEFWRLAVNTNIKLHDIYDLLPEIIQKRIQYGFMKINLDIQTLLQYPYEAWDWTYLTKHENITLEDMLAHPEFPWVWDEISSNPNIRFHHIQEHPKLPWKEYALYKNLSRTATFTEIMSQPNKLWYYGRYLSNPNHTKEELEELVLFTFINANKYWYEHGYDDYNVDKKSIWVYLCMNKRLTFSDLYDMYLQLNFRMFILIQEVKWLKHIKGIFPYNYVFKEQLLKGKVRPDGFVERDQAFQTMSLNPNIAVADLRAYQHENWDFHKLSVYFKDVNYALETPYLNWNKELLFSENPNMTADLVKKYQTIYTQAWEWFSKNPAANFQDIPTDNYSIFKLKGFITLPTFEEIRAYFAKNKIIRILVECISNPVYAQCRKRLLREHNELSV